MGSITVRFKSTKDSITESKAREVMVLGLKKTLGGLRTMGVSDSGV